jgi:hypothetical protein
MKQLLAIVALLFGFALRADLVTYTLTVTNAPVPGATTNLTVNGTTRYWTNVSTATKILTNTTTTAHSATNLYLDFARFPQRGVTVYMTDTNVVVFRGIDITLTQGGTWASVSTSTLTSTNLHALMIPFGNLPLVTRTNQAVEVFDALVAYTALASYGTATGNGVWVSKTGNDGTGSIGSIGSAFLTLTAAKAAANAGDTIFVLPGTYAEQDLLKDQVNWHFFNGAVVTNTSASLAIWQDNAGAITSTITGDGQFTGDGSYLGVVMSNAGSNVKIRGRLLGGTPVVQADAGTLTIEDSEIDTGGLLEAVLVSGTGAVLNLNRCRVIASAVDDNAIPIAISAANNDLTLRDCVLVSGGTNSVTASGAVNARIYGSLTANMTNHANVTWITGASRFEVDSDVR